MQPLVVSVFACVISTGCHYTLLSHSPPSALTSQRGFDSITCCGLSKMSGPLFGKRDLGLLLSDRIEDNILTHTEDR